MPITYFRSLLAMIRKPFYGNIPLFPAGQDMSWIPDGGTNVVTEFAAEAPTGTIVTAGNVTFTFTSVVKYLVWNGQVLKPPQDFTATGTTAVMGIAPGLGDEIYAII